MYDDADNPTDDREALIYDAYDAFNRRDISRALSIMAADVQWANGWEGGYVHGHDAVRDYWMRQWQQFNPSVTPRFITVTDDDRVLVTVDQVVRDLDGMVVGAGTVVHALSFRGGQVARMDIVEE